MSLSQSIAEVGGSAATLRATWPRTSERMRPGGSFITCVIASDGFVCAMAPSTLPMACARCAGLSAA